MECTQRVECTQDPQNSCFQRPSPTQIGFLGICGSKQPVWKGPNKIGRDPQTCAIILNDNSISRQHAVINILNKKDFMLMDLDSSNKTKLMGETLQPYIPHQLKNGDTVQFGQVFGIFRLLEDDDDLPMTQAVEIPETPINTRHVSRLKPTSATTIPESPDVSDRDDSIIGQAQSKKKTEFVSPNIKSSEKMLKPHVWNNKIDNMYWNSSNKSESFTSNVHNNSSYTIVNRSVSPKKFTVESSIYDMETQAPGLRDINETSDLIYDASTQVPGTVSPTIYNCETQLRSTDKLPEIFKLHNQTDVQLNLYSTNGNDKFNIFEAETQIMFKKKLNSSDEEICFDEIDSQEDICGSQPLLPPDDFCGIENLQPLNTNLEKTSTDTITKESANDVILNDSDSKDSEEIRPSQVVPEKPVDEDDDVTDCEDNMVELVVNNSNQPKKTQSDDDVTDCEDEVIEISQNKEKICNLSSNFEDLPTQIIGEENLVKENKSTFEKDDTPFEDMLTQVIEECPPESNGVTTINKADEIPFEELQTQVIDTVIPEDRPSSKPKEIKNNDNFKLPLSSPNLRKRNATPIKNTNFKTGAINELHLQDKVVDDPNYYDATQQIYNDLCSQNEHIVNSPGTKIQTRELSIKKKSLIRDRSSEDSDVSQKINNFVSNLSNEQIREVIGADAGVVPLKNKKSSDSSDVEVTPVKFNPYKFLMIDLPTSQEIKSCDFISSKSDATDSSDGLEDAKGKDNKRNGEDSHRNKRKKDIKLDLMRKFNNDTLSARTRRNRKPTSKILERDITDKRKSGKTHPSKSGFEQDADEEVSLLNSKTRSSKTETSKSKTTRSSKKSEKDKHVLVKLNLRKNDIKEIKENKLPQNIEKELKQQSIKTMFKDSISKDAIDTYENLKTESNDNSHKNRRSARNNSKGIKNEVTKLNDTEVKSESSEKKKSIKTFSSRKQDKETDLTKGQVTEVRRSRRHRSGKDQIEDKKDKSSRRSKENKVSDKSEKLHLSTSENAKMNKANDSVVYNLSSETVDSPVNLKRQATSEIFASKSKKTKSSNAVNESTTIRASSLRGIKTQYVLTTAFPCEEVKLKLQKLGAVIVTDVKACTVVLTLQIRRTIKLLCAVGLGKPIVGPNWVQACADCNIIVDPWLYLIKDVATEKRFGFNLRQSLTCKRNYLKGYNVFCTPNVTPPAEEMRSIVECSGGTWKEGGKSWICISCPADKALWPGLRKRGATLVSTEFILGGVLQQKINLERDKLG